MFGGSFEVAPETNHQDGTFNVTIFKHQKRIELVQCIAKILSGNMPLDDKDFISFETSEIDIDLIGDNEISFFGDGESLTTDTKWNIKCVPESLSVFSSKNINELQNFCTESTLM
jgi:diacylglycerol kinase family enzyme